MTFNELNEKLGGNERETDWMQSSAGGWMHKNATVEHPENIKENAIIFGNATVSGKATVFGEARVGGEAVRL